MGNCISKINKEHFLAFEEEIKNEILFFKRKTRCIIECVPEAKNIHEFIPWGSIQKGLPHYKLVCGGELFFKQVRCIINSLGSTMRKGTP